MVPVYPPGLPLTMAVMKLLFGERGVYVVVPLRGGLAVWLTYWLGREIYDSAAGLFAAVALFASPVFLLQLMAPMTGVVLLLARRYHWSAGFVLALASVLVCAGQWNGRLAFRVAEGEARYVRAAEVARSLPSNAVVISNLHSGSVRYYADRLTLRYEWLGVDAYGPALGYLRDQGRPVYAMLDDTEVDTFRQRYRDAGDVSWLDKPPMVTLANRVYLYLVAEGR